jgi:hypothetical protein
MGGNPTAAAPHILGPVEDMAREQGKAANHLCPSCVHAANRNGNRRGEKDWCSVLLDLGYAHGYAPRGYRPECADYEEQPTAAATCQHSTGCQCEQCQMNVHHDTTTGP